MGLIYMLKNTINNKIYIGQTTKTLRERLYGHKNRLDSSRHLVLAIQKYGWNAFSSQVLEKCPDEALDEREKFYIQFYEAQNPQKGYNMTEGGNVNRVHSPEARKKISEKNKGKVISLETREKMRKILKGRVFTEEWKQKIKKAKQNISPETRKKLSDSKKGFNYTDEIRHNMSESHKKFIYTIIDPSGRVETTDNLNKYCEIKGYHTVDFRDMIIKPKTKGKYVGWIVTKTPK